MHKICGNCTRCAVSRVVWLAALLGVLMGGPVHAEIFVIANPSADVSADDIRDIFVGEKLLATGVKLVPIDNATAQMEFLSKVLSLELSQYNSIWTKKGLQDGLNPPDVKRTDNDVILYVKRTPGAIGYVTSLGSSTTGFRTVRRF